MCVRVWNFNGNHCGKLSGHVRRLGRNRVNGQKGARTAGTPGIYAGATCNQLSKSSLWTTAVISNSQRGKRDRIYVNSNFFRQLRKWPSAKFAVSCHYLDITWGGRKAQVSQTSSQPPRFSIVKRERQLRQKAATGLSKVFTSQENEFWMRPLCMSESSYS